MLLFLNIDCLLAPPADASGPAHDGTTGLRRFEAVLHAWPQLRVVITSDRRYRMTLALFRSFFSMPLRSRLIATTPLYFGSAGRQTRRREDEVMDWLCGESLTGEPWLALDDSSHGYAAHAERLIECETFTEAAARHLIERLRQATHDRLSAPAWACFLNGALHHDIDDREIPLAA